MIIPFIAKNNTSNTHNARDQLCKLIHFRNPRKQNAKPPEKNGRKTRKYRQRKRKLESEQTNGMHVQKNPKIPTQIRIQIEKENEMNQIHPTKSANLPNSQKIVFSFSYHKN